MPGCRSSIDDPEVVASSAGSFGSVSPTSEGESESSPEEVGGKVLGTPEANQAAPVRDATASKLANESFAMEDHPCVGPNPDLIDLDLVVLLGPHAKANQVIVVVANQQASLFVGA